MVGGDDLGEIKADQGQVADFGAGGQPWRGLDEVADVALTPAGATNFMALPASSFGSTSRPVS